ncbi:bifunctional diaminohydroxyphosphoribosylaminopyrimidine deaminase/5-amino-6-(5-phosphoribosylamino)uracil reductase RibD [Candidatus Woesearchaeota archaeon]|nr:bifunctional diaminohydroxyphosphoribosylaminopyrimidine deaminase/5-amino-6-(5-phosphoribosylamino)uracil reductase RibD [Candidatus Woesearchaeota archaeon]
MIPHKKYMEMALELARKGKGFTSPNPMVGCIIIKRGRIVGKGFHKKAGEPHAEVFALREAGKKAKDGILYSTLEPCSHWGRTPPCTEQIIQSGIHEVIIGSKDINPLVNGYNEIKARGIKARIGILKEDCDKLNEYFFKWIKVKMPFVIVKAAMSLDGRIATRTGDSKYISGTEARKYVHQLRSEVDAVMVGINTALKDDPELTVRLVKGRNPKKVIVDTFLQLKENSNAVKNEPEKLIIATSRKANKQKIKALQQKGVKIITVGQEKGLLSLKELMKELGKHEIVSVMIEGGAELNAQALKAGIVDKILFFISPRMIGKGLAAVGDLGISKVDKSIQLRDLDYRKIGKDILIEGYL